ncbi:hypothetical protein SAMN06265827_12823 [Orenia metallireducens]|uniref:Uncharacterized protein n=1 Tax=Orenia metallireducens TaxID=1413210 RepID=A0A285I034_9FIRM|nr:hypothetical protein [Orenia metallireducens]SNY41243.1 hypothetical protein SAMN06265827_12823 [Orenia metallireducens]
MGEKHSLIEYKNNKKAITKGITNLHPLFALKETIDKGINLLKVREQETTKRHIIDKQAEVIIEKIRSERDNFQLYIEESFKERANNFDKCFELLDKGIENEDISAVNAAVHLITKQMEQDPLENYTKIKSDFFSFDEIEQF